MDEVCLQRSGWVQRGGTLRTLSGLRRSSSKEDIPGAAGELARSMRKIKTSGAPPLVFYIYPYLVYLLSSIEGGNINPSQPLYTIFVCWVPPTSTSQPMNCVDEKEVTSSVPVSVIADPGANMTPVIVT
jgi:hypothetical protein